MVKTVSFSGLLSKDNTLEIQLDENYLRLAVGYWQFRFEALSITTKILFPSVHLEVSTNLLDYPAFQTRGVGTNVVTSKVMAPCPIHLFYINALQKDVKKQLISGGQTQYEHIFQSGPSSIKLYFKDVEKVLDTAMTPLGLYVCGILLFNSVVVDL